MIPVYSQKMKYEFDRGLDHEVSPQDARALASRCSFVRRLTNYQIIPCTITAIVGFGIAPFAYQMWEAKQRGAGAPFAMASILLGLTGVYITYVTGRSTREYYRREKLALNKANELEQRINCDL